MVVGAPEPQRRERRSYPFAQSPQVDTAQLDLLHGGVQQGIDFFRRPAPLGQRVDLRRTGVHLPLHIGDGFCRYFHEDLPPIVAITLAIVAESL